MFHVKLNCLSFLLMFCISAPTVAQQPGVDCAPIQGQGWQGCAPMGPQQGATQAPRSPQWMNQWGAIASYTPGGILGVVTNMPSRALAKQLAMADCKNQGGGNKCKLEITYHDQCVALVLGDNVYNTTSALTIDQAAQSGIERCGKKSLNCHVYYSACSLPVRI